MDLAQEKLEQYAEILDCTVEEVKKNLTPSNIKQAYYKTEPKAFIDELVKIEDKDSADPVISFDLWPKQKEALDKTMDNDKVIYLKARQLGMTWLALAIGTHLILFHEGKSISTISIKEEDTKELVRRVEFILRHLPDWLIVEDKAKPETLQKNKTGITYTKHSTELIIHHPGDKEQSKLNGHTSSPSAARSFTDNLIILDEWAFHPQAREIWRAAFPVINRPTGGKIIGISTGEKGTLFEEKWNNAEWEYGGETGNGSNMFTGVFLPWDADPRRDQEWFEQTKQEMNNYRSEYPSTPSEAFTTGEGQFFTEFSRDLHLPYGNNWYPPRSWRIIIAYDGGYNRAAAKWYAISNDGWAICYREYYPNNKVDPEQMEDIRELSRDPEGNPEQISYIIADTSCWAKQQDTGRTTVEIGEHHGIRPWRQADKERIMGWKRLHEWLHPIRDEQGNIIKDRFGNKLAKLRYTESCTNTIRIFPGLKAHKNKPDDLGDGQEDHLFDCFVEGTMITTFKGKKRVENMEKGDYVLTRKGYKKVVMADRTRKTKVYEISFDNGKKLIGTGDHPIYTKNKGFIPLDSLRYDDIIEVEENIEEDDLKWEKKKLKWLNSKELNTEDIPMLTIDQIEYILDHLDVTSKEDMDIYIKKFGKMLTERYQKNTISIIKTAIRLIITWKILNVFQEQSIYQNLIMGIEQQNGCEKFKKKLKNGINLKKVENGIANMVKKFLKIKNQKQLNVNNVEKNLKQKCWPDMTMLNTVLTLAKQKLVENQGLMMKSENVLSAAKNLPLTNIVKPKLVQKVVRVNSSAKLKGIRTVHNLKVEGQPEYFANGILTHNCDRYFVMSRPKAPLSQNEKKKRKKKRKRKIQPKSKVVGY